MSSPQYPVEGLELDVSFQDYDPADWRNHSEPPGQDNDDDEEGPTPLDVIAITGIDPDEDW